VIGMDPLRGLDSPGGNGANGTARSSTISRTEGGGSSPNVILLQVLSTVTHSEDETINLGRQIASTLPKKAVVLLIGNLGAGKTTLAKGIVSGLGAVGVDEVSSPTFTLIHEYSPSVIHIDLYRLDTEREVATLGLDDIFDREAVVLIEWGERFPRLLPEGRYEIRITPVDEDSRRIEVLSPSRQPE
jgi:tRNA threonylcarbamoyladenosine biosynthesis protein TsaE